MQKEANEDFVSNMHIGRSRNDMGVAMYRMSLRRFLLRFMEHFMLLQESMLDTAAEHMETIMPAYTHAACTANNIWSLYFGCLRYDAA